jgi:iron complex transport system permease protein
MPDSTCYPPDKISQPQRVNPWILGIILLVATLLVIFFSLYLGDTSFTLSEIINIIGHKLFKIALPANMSEPSVMIIWDVRLPRCMTAVLAGAALGLSGAIFQGILLNPLADPYTLGVSSGAAFGASLVIVTSLILPLRFLAFPLSTAVGAFIASVLTLFLVMLLASDSEGHLPAPNLILAGVIMSAILSAAISFMKYLAGDQVNSIIFWLLGSFVAKTWTEAFIVLLFFIPSLIIALLKAMDLNIMTLGLRSAETLGVNTGRTRFLLLVSASIAASASVSVSGIIGFVGLIVPHVIRLLSGPDHRALLPLSAIGGAMLLSAADLTVRVILPGEIPVGVLTALLAGPAFLVIFRRKMREIARAY